MYWNEDKCVAVEQQNLLEGCKLYNSHQNCVKCKNGFILDKKNDCVKIQKIQNCHKKDKQCTMCQRGLIVNGLCLENKPQFQNCENATTKNGKQQLVNLNNYNDNQIMMYMSINYLNSLLQTSYSLAQIFEANCQEFDTKSQKCILCKKDFFLNQDHKCIAHQQAILNNCDRPLSASSCYRCIRGYYLNEEQACTKIIKELTYCLEYDQKTLFCKQCQPDFYLKDEKCLQRKYFDANCILYNIKEDECFKCQHGYYWNKKDKMCKDSIPLCNIVYQKDNSLYCQQCQEEYALSQDKKVCLFTPKIPNCKFYKGYFNCSECNDDYYLSQNQCIKYEDGILIQRNKQVCPLRYFQVNQLDVCIQVFDQPFCEILNSNNKCIKCEDFYILEKGQCKKGNVLNCKTYDKNDCKACQSGFQLVHQICIQEFDVFTQNRQVDKKSQFKQQCLQNYAPLKLIQLQNPYIKMKNTRQKHKHKIYFKQNISLQIQPERRLQHSQKIFQFQFCDDQELEQYFINADNCQIYNIDSKKCEKCQVQYGLEEDKCIKCEQFGQYGKCIKVPKEKIIQGCEIYDDQFYCIKCQNMLHKQILDKKRLTKCFENLSEFCETKFCLMPKKISTKDYCCQKCQNGKTGIIQQMNEISYINNCNLDIEYCDIETIYQNIPEQYNSILSCHKCIKGQLTLTNKNGQPQVQCIESQQNIEGCFLYDESQCILCLPGYIQKNSNCLKIEHCIKSQQIQLCEQCEEGYALSKQNICIKNNITNCLIAEEEQQCAQCQNGYFMYKNTCLKSPDKLCEIFEGPNCIKCKKHTDIIIKKSFDEQIQDFLCIEPPKEDLIQHCQQYEALGVCQKCKENFILHIKSNNNTVCRQNFNNENCLTINSQLDCISCKAGYYLEKGLCMQGKQDFCAEYKDYLNCVQCKEGYQLTKVQNRQICVITNSVRNCLVHEEHLFQGIKCKKCLPGFIKKNIDFDTPSCIKYYQITNCEKNNGKNCEKCLEEFYLQKGQCQKRQRFPIQNCQLYQTDKDLCYLCVEGYIQQNGNCVQQKSQINHCRQQLDEKQCLKCHKNYYLSKGSCKKVKIQQENCEIYDSEYTCEKCKQSYFVDDRGACISMRVNKNCQQFNRDQTCKKCRADYYLSNSECKKVKNYIQDCDYYNQNQECIECRYGYKLEDQYCKEDYENIKEDIECNACQAGYILDKGQCKKLQQLQDEKCAIFNEKDDSCLVCREGNIQASPNECVSAQEIYGNEIQTNALIMTILKKINIYCIYLCIAMAFNQFEQYIICFMIKKIQFYCKQMVQKLDSNLVQKKYLDELFDKASFTKEQALKVLGIQEKNPNTTVIVDTYDNAG